MKKLLLLLTILFVSTSAFAALIDVPTFSISVNGEVRDDLDEIILMPSDIATVEILGSNNDNFPHDFWLICQDPGLISGGTIIYSGSLSSIYTATSAEWESIFGFEIFAMFGFEDTTSASDISLADGHIPPAELNGLLVGDISLTTMHSGQIVLSLVSDDFATIYDRQYVLQTTASPVPEPATIAMLSFSAMLFVKRK